MTSKFDAQLEKLLMGDDVQSEDGEQEESNVPDLLPVHFEEKQTGLTLAEDNPDLAEDYKFARSNLYGLIGRSNAAVELALRIAQMSEHPRAIEVAANLMKTSADMSKDLIALQKQITGTPDKDKTIAKNTQINNYYGNEPKSSKDIDSDLDKLPDEK